jgi:hypothetical protein
MAVTMVVVVVVVVKAMIMAPSLRGSRIKGGVEVSRRSLLFPQVGAWGQPLPRPPQELVKWKIVVVMVPVLTSMVVKNGTKITKWAAKSG